MLSEDGGGSELLVILFVVVRVSVSADVVGSSASDGTGRKG